MKTPSCKFCAQPMRSTSYYTPLDSYIRDGYCCRSCINPQYLVLYNLINTHIEIEVIRYDGSDFALASKIDVRSDISCSYIWGKNLTLISQIPYQEIMTIENARVYLDKLQRLAIFQ